MQEKYFLYPSNIVISNRSEWIVTILGSCVAVCLFDPTKAIGSMNHYMLPYWNGKEKATPKYGNIAIKKIIDNMYTAGCQQQNLKAKLFGGANINLAADNPFSINKQNISLARLILAEYEIPIVSQNVGGFRGRKIQFNPATGEVRHKFIDSTRILRTYT